MINQVFLCYGKPQITHILRYFLVMYLKVVCSGGSGDFYHGAKIFSGMCSPDSISCTCSALILFIFTYQFYLNDIDFLCFFGLSLLPVTDHLSIMASYPRKFFTKNIELEAKHLV